MRSGKTSNPIVDTGIRHREDSPVRHHSVRHVGMVQIDQRL